MNVTQIFNSGLGYWRNHGHSFIHQVDIKQKKCEILNLFKIHQTTPTTQKNTNNSTNIHVMIDGGEGERR